MLIVTAKLGKKYTGRRSSHRTIQQQSILMAKIKYHGLAALFIVVVWIILCLGRFAPAALRRGLSQHPRRALGEGSHDNNTGLTTSTPSTPPTLWEAICSTTSAPSTTARCQAHASQQLNVPCQRNDADIETLLRRCLVTQPVLAPAHCPSLLQSTSGGEGLAPLPQQHSIAFSIVAHADALALLQLVDAIWRPHHQICIHLDAASSVDRALRAVVKIMTERRVNVIVPVQTVNVGYGTLGRVEAELACMEMLLLREWDSFINLSGQEYPLHPIQWIERSVAELQGHPNIEYVPEAGAFQLPRTTDKATQANFAHSFPHGLIKGSGYVVLPRAAVLWLLRSAELGFLRSLFTDGFVRLDPFERVYTTLLWRWHDGDWALPLATHRDYTWKAKYVQWEGSCYGRPAIDTHPCVLAIGDLPRLISGSRVGCGKGAPGTPVCAADALFANKMVSSVDSLLTECLRASNAHASLQAN